VRARRKAATGEAPHALEPARLRRDYERLRAAAVAGGPRGWRWGRSVLQRAGVAGWMRAWSDHARAGQELSMNVPSRAKRGQLTLLGERGAAAAGSRLPVAACGAGTLPVDADAIVTLLAQLVRGVLDATPGAGGPRLGVSA